MDVDFALILTVAVLVCGIVWGFDLLALKPSRQRRAEAAVASARAAAGDTEAGNRQELEAALEKLRQRELREPVVVEYAHSFFGVLLVVWVLRSFLVEPFTIPSGSMLPTLQVGDYILVNKYAYGLRLPVVGTEVVPVGKPQRGDIMVFKYPEQPSVNYIKRVIGLPGDRIRIRGGRVYVNGEALPREVVSLAEAESWELYYRERSDVTEHLIRHEAGREATSPEREWLVPEGGYFMLGDNRDNSRDSRYWGFVPDRYIVGKAFYIWMHKKPGPHLPGFGRNGKVI